MSPPPHVAAAINPFTDKTEFLSAKKISMSSDSFITLRTQIACELSIGYMVQLVGKELNTIEDWCLKLLHYIVTVVVGL